MINHTYEQVEFPGLPFPRYFAGQPEKGASPYYVATTLSGPELTRRMYMGMPIPSILGDMDKMLRAFDPESNMRVTGIIGPTGIGKSYIAKWLRSLWSDEEIVIVDCAGQDAGFLLREAVIDEHGESVFALLEQKNQLSALTIAELRKEFKEDEMIETGRRVKFDQAKIDVRLKANGLDLQKMHKHVLAAAAMEGIHMQQSGDLEFKTMPGVLLGDKAVFPDEISSAMPGTDKQLNSVLDFYIGSEKSCTVRITPTYSITLTRANLAPGKFIFFAGNTVMDGAGTHDLPESVSRRGDLIKVTHLSIADWQHRICQMLTGGIAVSTLLKFAEDKFNNNPNAALVQEYAKRLEDLKLFTLSDEQVNNIPVHEFTYLAKWQELVLASEKMAKLYDKAYQLTVPELARKITGLPTEVIEELEQGLHQSANFDLAIVVRNIQEALKLPRGDTSSVEKNFGTRLERQIHRSLHEFEKLGKPNMYKYLLKQARQLGVLPPELKQAVAAQGSSLSNLLNCESVVHPRTRKNELVTEIIDCLRAEYPNMPDHLLQPDKIMAALKAIQKKKAEPGQINAAVLGSGGESVVETCVIADRDLFGDNIDIEKLLDHRSLLLAIARPELNPDFDMQQLFVPLLQDDEDMPKESIKMAEGRSEGGLATTSLICKASGIKDAACIHIIRNTKQTGGNNTIMVGPEINDKMQTMLRKRGITYISNVAGNKDKLANAINTLVPNPYDQCLLKQAFALRNEVPQKELFDKVPKQGVTVLENVPFSVMVLEAECQAPAFAVNVRSLEECKHLAVAMDRDAEMKSRGAGGKS